MVYLKRRYIFIKNYISKVYLSIYSFVSIKFENSVKLLSMKKTLTTLLRCLAMGTISIFNYNGSVAQTLFQKTYNSTTNSPSDYNTLFANSVAKVNDNKFILAGSGTFNNAEDGAGITCVDSLGKVIWSKKYGNSPLNGEGFNSVKFTSDQKIVVAGTTLGVNGSNPFGKEGYVIKIDIDGNLIWQKKISNPGYVFRFSTMAEDQSGNLYILGITYDNLAPIYVGTTGLILKLDKNGNEIWQKTYSQTGSTSLDFGSITISQSGKIFIAATNGLEFYSGSIIELNPNGDINWSKTYRAFDYTSFMDITALPNNDLVIAGKINDYQIILKTDSIGTVLWSKSTDFQTYPDDDDGLKISPDGNSIYLIGNHIIDYPQRQATLTKFKLNGDLNWIKEYGYCDEEAFNGFEFGANSTIMLAGTTRSYGVDGTNLFLVRSDTAGYTSCMDVLSRSNYISTHLKEETILTTPTSSTYPFENHTTVVSEFLIIDSLICSSTNPVGLRFHSNDTVICANSCISFINGSTFHKALDDASDTDGSPMDTSKVYKWLFPGSSTPIVDAIENPTNVCYPIPGKYSVSMIVTQGCKIDTLFKENYIEVLAQNPVVTITGNTSVCSGTATTLTASGANTYTWSPSTGLNTTTGATVIANPSTPTTYTVIGEAGNCTIVPQTVFVSVNTTPTVTVTPSSPLTICTGQSKELKATGATNYSWSPALGLSSTTSATVTANPETTTTYTIIGSNGSCADTVEVLITVVPSPVVGLTNDLSITWGNSSPLLVTGGETYSYSWSPTTNLSCTDCSNPIASPTKNTNYCVTVTNLNNCSSTKCVSITVNIDCGELFVPNSFSPNGDKLNDSLEVKLNPGCVEEYTFIIFDRWGEKIFESNSINSSWDGKKNGKDLDNAVFVYYLKMKLIDSTTVEKKGNVSIIR